MGIIDRGEVRMQFRHLPLDRIAALAGAVVSAVLALYAGIYNRNPLYILTVALALAACLLWVARSKEMNLTVGLPSPRSVVLALSCLFFALFTTSMLAVYFRPDPYVRPLIYFVMIAIMAATVGGEILLAPAAGYHYVRLAIAQTILIGLSLSWTEQLLFPSVTGVDPSWHMMFTSKLIELGRVPPNYGYSSFPITHLATASVMLTTNTSYKIAAMLSIGFVQVSVEVMIVYLFGRFLIHSDRIGLLGALVLVTADYYVQFGWWATPTTLAAVFLLTSLYLLLKVRSSRQVEVVLLVLLFGVAIVLTHTVTTAAFVLILIVFWVTGRVRRRLSLTQALGSPLTAWVPMLFFVMMFGWWAYAFSNPFITLTDIIRSGFSIDAFYQGPRYLGYPATVPLIERAIDVIGFVVLFALSLIGCLHLVRTKELICITFSAIGLTVLLVGFISLVLGREILNARWWYYGQILLALPAAMGVVLVSSLTKRNRLRHGTIVAVIFCLSFVMILNSTANTDNPLLSPDLVVRNAFTTSEMMAASFVSTHWEGRISSDFLYGTNPSSSAFTNYYQVDQSRLRSLDPELITGNFTTVPDLVVIRSVITDHPFVLAGGRVRLSYDPNAVLSATTSARVYDSGSVTVYMGAG